MFTVDIKKELVERAEKYFDSIEDLFFYSEENGWKFITAAILHLLTGLLLFSSIFPIVSIEFKDTLIKIFGNSLKISNYIIDVGNFYILWLVTILGALFLFSITFLIKKIYKARDKRCSVSSKDLPFAYIATTIKELNLFSINGRRESLNIAKDYLKKYYKNSEAYSTSIQNQSSYLPAELAKMTKDNFWIKYDSLTEKTVTALLSFDLKISTRIEQNKEIDLVINSLNNLLIYEYIKIKKNNAAKGLTTGQSTIQLRQSFFYKFCEEINALTEIQRPQEARPTKPPFSKKIIAAFSKINGVFTHKIIFITFISWTFLLSLIFIPVLFMLMKLFILKMDSTILIGLLGAIMAGAITFTVTYSKNTSNN
ncbi:hypothetical protein [Mucilaginibacter gilvus]|uniref:Uncharacterized protein n=1 Tax=Mucilaginibacter gilvus TaxID=2305909 RepID=A0A3S3Z8E7_9SPHI|nr:hypothetical protein [Mucilaginibacter gilvus]RWY55570.1 hypothetical protein EPL05_04125 [Mucilaginibacter gilvus]